MKLTKAVNRVHWKAIRNLYEEAFPDYEKKPFWLIWLKSIQGQADVWYIEEEGQFVGIGITMLHREECCWIILPFIAVFVGTDMVPKHYGHYRNSTGTDISFWK